MTASSSPSTSRRPIGLSSRRTVYLALAAEVPKDGKLVANPYKTWKEVNAELPDWPIAAYIPGEKHGTREVFEEKVLRCRLQGRRRRQALPRQGRWRRRRAKKKAADKAARKVRKDGAAVDIDGDYTETLARLDLQPEGRGRVRSVLLREQHRQAEGRHRQRRRRRRSRPSPPASIRCRVRCSFYVKKAHIGVIPGLKEYVEFFSSDKMIGPDGPLAEYGLVPAPDAERQKLQEAVKAAKTM